MTKFPYDILGEIGETTELTNANTHDGPKYVAPYNEVERQQIGDGHYIMPLSRQEAGIPMSNRSFQGLEVNNLDLHEIRLMTDAINRLRQTWQITKQQMYFIMGELTPLGLTHEKYLQARSELMEVLDRTLTERYPLTIRTALSRWFLGPQPTFDKKVTDWMYQNCYDPIQKKQWDDVKQHLLACSEYTELQVLAISPLYIKRYWENTARRKMMKVPPE